MNTKLFQILLARIRKFRSEYSGIPYRNSFPLKAEAVFSKDPIPFSALHDMKFQSVEQGQLWGHAWDNAWFHITGTLPAGLEGKEICLLLNLAGELLLVDKKGVPIYGLTAGSVYDAAFQKDRFVLGRNFKKGKKFEFYAEAVSMQIMGTSRSGLHPFGSYESHVRVMEICEFDREAWHFMQDLDTVLSLLDVFGEGDYRSNKLLDAATTAVDTYMKTENAADGRRELASVLAWRAADSALEVWSVGHAHIDIAWLWRLRESRRKAARTFASQLANMEKYPSYVFGASQAHLYRCVKQDYPELYANIKKRVKSGQWEVQGGMWVEADANIISGESMVRQFLHGKNFFRDEFGVDVNNLWLPDVFGYSASMPQIIKKSGCDYFLTQKISWSQINRFPAFSFRWKGVDGSEILTHFPPADTYNSTGTPKELAESANRFTESGITDKFVSLFGIGDGGGGPAEEHVERFLRARDLEGCPKVKLSRICDFFLDMEKSRSHLPVWSGELYLELHRGTLTTQGRTKRNNRQCEQSFTELEFLASCLPLNQWPEDLDEMWKSMLSLQFHDILPGSSIPQVYEDTEAEHARLLGKAKDLKQRTAESLFEKSEDSAVVVNSLSYERTVALELPASWADRGATRNGKALTAQSEDSVSVVQITLPAYSFTTIRKGKELKRADVTRDMPLVLENDLIRYEFSSAGRLISAYDKELRRETLEGDGNVLSLYHDDPNNYDAWDIDIYYSREFLGNPECVSAKMVTSGPVRSSLRLEFHTQHSKIIQRVTLNAFSKGLDFSTLADWHESHVMLRTAFPVSVHPDEASFDIQYAFLKRPTHNNTTWDLAKFEVCGQRYADLSEHEFGAALLNDCKYGYKVKDNVLDLCLLRSPKSPDYFADQGIHFFSYCFLPHADALPDSPVMAEAASLNRAPYIADGFSAGKAVSPVQLEADGITLEVVKKAEKEDCRILRIVETKGRHSKGVLKFKNPKAKLAVTNLLEWTNEPGPAVVRGKAEISLKPFEIMTLKLY